MAGKKTTLLCILDGFGFNPNPLGNAVAMAHKPNFDRLWAGLPNSTLVTHGERVGLPAGQMGNSEVGHLNIGAGRVLEQWLLRISKGLQDEFLNESAQYQDFVKSCSSSPAIHLVGLFSEGGVHSNAEHLYLMIKRLLGDTLASLYLHLISDGRDCSPTAFRGDVANLLLFIKDHPRCKIAGICGRFFAMDRDKRWPRTEKAFDVICRARAQKFSDILSWLDRCYAANVTDEFLEPALIEGMPIEKEHGLIFWNFRADRMRQIVSALCLAGFSGFKRNLPPHPAERVLCFTEYDGTFGLPYLFPQIEIKNHIGEVLADRGMTQLRTAETEKYPHVTYFFNGGVEEPYSGEERKLVPSPRDVKTYDQKPQMSALEVTEVVLEGIRSAKYDFIVVNYANCDMVGHTGVLEAAIKAVETVDLCLGNVVAELERCGGQGLIIADHGNAEQMIHYEDGSPHTAHTTYPVPVIMVGTSRREPLRSGGALCDVAPTLLKMMNIPKPAEMRGVELY